MKFPSMCVHAYLWLCECLLVYVFGEKKWKRKPDHSFKFSIHGEILWSQKESFAIYFIAFLSSTSDDLLSYSWCRCADKSHLLLLVWEIIVFQFKTAFEMGGNGKHTLSFKQMTKKYQMNTEKTKSVNGDSLN